MTIDYANLIGEDRVHSTLYTSRRVYEDELERIFHGGWVFVGHESEVPAGGNYVTRTIGREPVVMLRNRRGEIRVFANRCPHRGNKLCSFEAGSAKSLTCAYHGWTFSLDGDLAGMPYPNGFTKDKAQFALQSPPLVQSYRGFVFASFNRDVPGLADHLGNARHLIDRAVEMSPAGAINLRGGWVKQHYRANWKMLPENDTDGYHANFVHASFLKVFRSQYDAIMSREEDRRSRVVDWGGGHTAIDASPMYREPFEWLGTTAERVTDYVRLMTAAYGAEKARAIMVAGPPHAVVFPNLFLGEMNIVIFQPLAENEAVQWHTPMLLEGVPDSFNARIIRQSEAALGPSAFLLADDSVISERQQMALEGRAQWLDLSRGTQREVRKDGVITSHISDETTNRGFWRHYRHVMTQARRCGP